ncbi:MAG: putative capsid protein [Macrobrachium rosenbergii virus 2]|nr:MAG: putative capsid protein [Macrobrachium rosenbergii virus 2]
MQTPEPTATEINNVQFGGFGHKLPEQSQMPVCNIPRPISFSSWICQWQPMGIRVVVNLPFVGNDRDFLFAIRNGPFIPRWDVDYTTLHGNHRQFAWNNMRNVIHGQYLASNFGDKPSIFITQYDYPPPLAQMALAFRKWRGTMHYRIRTVAGFATQGYVFVAAIKNTMMPAGVFDEYKTPPSLWRQDSSYKELMLNSYIMSDTSMFRHVEAAMPFEYPMQWYDQFAWISRRVSNDTKECKEGGSIPETYFEPTGDNFLVMGVRGDLAATQEGAQIMFELEYRADENFQFSDPGLPPLWLNRPIAKNLSDTTLVDKIKRIPDKNLESDGIKTITHKSGVQLVKETTPLPTLATMKPKTSGTRGGRHHRELDFM